MTDLAEIRYMRSVHNADKHLIFMKIGRVQPTLYVGTSMDFYP